MAKISARGAKEVDRRRIADVTYVATTDGRVLQRYHYSGGGSSGYTVCYRIKKGADVAKAFGDLMGTLEEIARGTGAKVSIAAAGGDA